MAVWIVLLRGVNVGGSRIIPMNALRDALGDAGFEGVQTYIQSGNLLFRSSIASREAVGEAVGNVIERGFGFRPRALVLTPDELDTAISSNPFATDAGKALHLMFLDGPLSAIDLDGLRAATPDNEHVEVVGSVLYVCTPDGFGRSVVARKLGRFVTADMTARNLNTATKIAQLALESMP